MGLWKSLFGSNGGADESAPMRVLDHPKKLMRGDLVKFKVFVPKLIRARTFEVDDVNTYHFKTGEVTEYVLKGGYDEDVPAVYMSYEEEDGRETVSISLKINREAVEHLFDLDQFAQIFNDKNRAEVQRKSNIEDKRDPLHDLEGWVAERYVREGFFQPAFFHEEDYRGRVVPTSADEAEGFDYYVLYSPDRKHAIEIENYDDGEDVMLTINYGVDIIEEMWPKQ